MNVDQVSNDVLLEIFYNLDPTELNRLCQTNKRMRQLCQSEQLWKNKYLMKYGQPKRLNEGSWKKAFSNRYTTYPQGSEYVIMSYNTEKETKNPIAIFRGDLNDVYDKLAEILNNQIRHHQKLYELLRQTYDLYVRVMRHYFGPDLITQRQYSEQGKTGCKVIDCLVELPLSGQDLRDIIDYLQHSDLRSEYLIVEEYPLYIVS